MTDYEKFLQLIEECENSGGDIAGLKSHVSTLAAGGATPFLGLNQWKRSDKPVMDDFNDDNRKIDDAVRELWEKKANIGPPEEYDLELADGFEFSGNDGRNNTYYKSQEGQVTITMDITKTTGAFTGGETAATLPEGFRVRRLTTVIGMYQSSNSTEYVMAAANFITNGDIVIDSSGASYNRLILSCCYLAAQ